MTTVNNTPIWNQLEQHYQAMRNVQMRDLFAQDTDRFAHFSLHLDDLLFDYSKNRITSETLKLLLELAKQAKLSEKIEAMFTGQKINRTEDRAVLHVALRNRSNTPILVDGVDVMPEVNAVLARMAKFCNETANSGRITAPDVSVSGTVSKHDMNGRIRGGGPLVDVRADSGHVDIR